MWFGWGEWDVGSYLYRHRGERQAFPRSASAQRAARIERPSAELIHHQASIRWAAAKARPG
jgi:hypothetical protein